MIFLILFIFAQLIVISVKSCNSKTLKNFFKLMIIKIIKIDLLKIN